MPFSGAGQFSSLCLWVTCTNRCVLELDDLQAPAGMKPLRTNIEETVPIMQSGRFQVSMQRTIPPT